ncbi:protein RAE1 isoform X2 [Arachis hypogaea]|uniref:protein RAE1 isoform X2 n=1 Tax=Arachis hypogaea TaxID=3818 RepID=UPI000DEDD3D5|nr:protein RAE1 isoform X1 [Arachis hypogaea]
MSTFGSANTNPNKSYEVTQPPGDSISSLCFSSKANFLVTTSWDNQIARNGTVINSTPKASISHDQPVLCSTWKDDGTTVFSGGCDKQVKMVSRFYIEQRSWKSNKQRGCWYGVDSSP